MLWRQINKKLAEDEQTEAGAQHTENRMTRGMDKKITEKNVRREMLVLVSFLVEKRMFTIESRAPKSSQKVYTPSAQRAQFRRHLTD